MGPLAVAWGTRPATTTDWARFNSAYSQELIRRIDEQIDDIAILGRLLRRSAPPSPAPSDVWVEAPDAADYQVAYEWRTLEVTLVEADSPEDTGDGGEVWR